ncbi:MAG TPA: hypothetical protein VLE43_11895, partial [Candidatus Saccharimonadia bacterium]|nr:hypothetical protein [Candidatus Saccharimonadia bacterium]
MSAFPESVGQISDKAAEAMNQAQGMAHQARETAIHAAEKAGELCNTTTTEVENFARRHPVWAVAATVGIGYALGLLARELL